MGMIIEAYIYWLVGSSRSSLVLVARALSLQITYPDSLRNKYPYRTCMTRRYGVSCSWGLEKG